MTEKGRLIVEHIPFLYFYDGFGIPVSDTKKNTGGLEIRVSDIKKKPDGSEYVTIYFEQPNRQQTDCCTAQYDYPGGHLEQVRGFSEEDCAMLLEHVARIGDIAFDFSKERETDSPVEKLYGCASNIKVSPDEIRTERREIRYKEVL